MLIAIFISLLTQSSSELTGERFRFERLQGQCSAWCYEKYGNYTITPKQLGIIDQGEVYQCLSNDTDCLSCENACKKEFSSLAECYSRCNEEAPCQRGCANHQRLSRIHLDMDPFINNTYPPYPTDIYENPDKRNNSSVWLRWNHVEYCRTPAPCAVVYMMFIRNFTTNEDNPQLLYIGSTPHFSFIAAPLSQRYCYQVTVLSVTKDRIIGLGPSSGKFVTDATIHADEVTDTSASFWFITRPCEAPLTYKFLITKKTDSQNPLTFTEFPGYIDEDNKFHVQTTNLSPNTEYSTHVKRILTNNPESEKFSLYGDFTTKKALPSQPLAVLKIYGVTEMGMWLNFEVNRDSVNDDYIDSCVIKITDSAGELIRQESVSPSYNEQDRDSSPHGLYQLTESFEDLTPYTEYCFSAAVSNSIGQGPFSEPTCERTKSAPAGPPTVTVHEIFPTQSTVEITFPERPNGLIVSYNVSYVYDGALIARDFNVSDGNVTLVQLEGLECHTNYSVYVVAVNSLGSQGQEATTTFTTLQGIPEAGPTVSVCEVRGNKTHVESSVSWVGLPAHKVNGEIKQFTLNIQQYNAVNSSLISSHTHNFSLDDADQRVYEVLQNNLTLRYSKTEQVIARLAVSTEVGMGPWSRSFLCKVAAPIKMGVNTVAIMLPILAVAILFAVLVGTFFYFFRFKTYKKTPYEEIKKMIRPDTFSPCQHCMYNKEPKRWDVFICHVREDEEYIELLKEAFVREKIDVFFAKDELSWGCELHRVINDGLRDSKYGLVVLSKHFVSKCSKWTSSELFSLYSKSRLTSQDCILPIWKRDITEVEVGAFDMTLVGIKALKEEEMSVDQMAVELKKVLRSSGCWGCSIRKLNNQNSGQTTPNNSDEEVPLIDKVVISSPVITPPSHEDHGTNV